MKVAHAPSPPWLCRCWTFFYSFFKNYSKCTLLKKRNTLPLNPGNHGKHTHTYEGVLLPSPKSQFAVDENKLRWTKINAAWARLSSIPKGYFFFPEESMRWLIASPPHCPWWFMGASVSRSVGSRQEFTDKEAVRQTYPSRATLKTVRKTGSSKPAQQQPGGVLVRAFSVCGMPYVELRFPFQSSSWRLTVLISTIKGSSQGCSDRIEWPTFYVPRAGYHCRFVMKLWSLELRQSLKSELEGG